MLLLAVCPWQTSQAASLFLEPKHQHLEVTQPMGVCISHSLISPCCPPLRPIHQQLTHWAGPGSTPSKGNPSPQACVCSTAPTHTPVLHAGWEAARVACRTETSPSQAASLEGSSYPPLAEALAHPWLGQLARVGGKTTSSPRPCLQAGLGSRSGWVAGWPALAAVHGVDEERGAQWDPALARQHGPNHDPTPSTCPQVGAERAARFCAACGGCPALLRQMRGSRFSSRVI